MDSLEDDFHWFHLQLARALQRSVIRAVLADLHAEQPLSTEVAEATERLTQDRRDLGRTILKRTIDRGELPPSIDQEFALELLAALIYWRIVVTRGPMDATAIDHWTTSLIAAISIAR